MARYTVSEVAVMARISVRTLHHYHEIGLLLPADVGANGYRYYTREELLRLQQILLHRDLGIPLAEIAALLDAPDFDRLAALRRQRAQIAQAMARSAEMLETIDRTIARLEGDGVMSDEELYTGIVDPEKQAAYETWLAQRFGASIQDDIEVSRRATAKRGVVGRQAMIAELATIEQALAEALRSSVAPQDRRLDPWVERHHAWVAASWGREAPIPAYVGLAGVYREHPDFVARFEAITPGFTDYLATAMVSWGARQM